MNTDILIGYLICMAMYEIIRPFCGKLWDCYKRLHGWLRRRQITMLRPNPHPSEFQTMLRRLPPPSISKVNAVELEGEFFPRPRQYARRNWHSRRRLVLPPVRGELYDAPRIQQAELITWRWPRVPGCAR